MYLRGLSFLLLLSSALGDCTSELLAVIGRFTTIMPTDTPSAMAAASGKWLNDLGDYSACTRIAEAEYALLYMKVEGTFIGLGLCGPKTCSIEDYYEFLGKLQTLRDHPFSSLLSSLSEASYQVPLAIEMHAKLTAPEVTIVFPRTLIPTGLSFGAGVMVFCCALLIVCVIAGTLLETFYVPSRKPSLQKESIELMEIRENLSSSQQSLATETGIPPQRSLLQQSLACFSLTSTLPRLFSVSDKERADPLFSLNAIRVLSMLWIVLGHVLLFGLTGGMLKNPQDLVPFFKQMYGAFLFSAHYAVDTFLWLTGFLLAYILLQKMTVKGDSPSVGQLYVHRFVRIVPTLAFTMFLSWTMAPYSAQGPLAFSMNNLSESCEKYWWTTLLFINNEYPDWLGNPCFGHTWYLAVDMQLYLVAVPIVLLYHRKRAYGWLGVIAMCSVSLLSAAIIVWKYQFGVMPLTPGNLENNQFGRYYVKLYTRGAPLALGLCTAFLFHSAKMYKSASQVYDAFALRLVCLLEVRSVRRICFIIAITLGLFMMGIQNDAFQGLDDESERWTRGENTLFMSTYRLLWGLSLSLFLLPLLLGLSPMCQWVLSWSVWAPLAKLSFCVYLVHLHITFAYRYSGETARWFGNMNIYTDFCFVTVISFAVSAAIYLCVEMPAQSLTRVLLKVA